MQVVGKYDRQSRIAGWDQKKIRNAKVMVLGAGALGNEIVKNLALIGVGSILIVDFDTVELSNLSRTVLFTINDIGKPKAETLAKAALKLNPDTKANYINGDIFYDIGLGFYKNVDLVIGALDNLAGRSQAGSCANLVGKPFIDSGIWDHGGEVRWFFPFNSVCFDCLLSDHDKNTIAKRHSCTGFKPSSDSEADLIRPSTLTPITIIAGIAVQEICYFLCNIREIHSGEAIVYNGLQLSLHRSILQRNPDCQNHIAKPYENIYSIPYNVNNIKARELIQLASKRLGTEITIELGRDFLLSLTCENCNETELIKNLISKVPEEMSCCPNCKQLRKKRVYTSITSSDEISAMSLAELGVPVGDILVLHSKALFGFFEIIGDIKKYYS